VDIAGLGFGLVQHKGGPCGVLAVVQAFLLAPLVHGYGGGGGGRGRGSWKQPKEADRKDALAWALATVIWRAGAQAGRALVATVGADTQPGVKADGVTEKLRVQSFGSERVSASGVSRALCARG
jgi:hypothetical protein